MSLNIELLPVGQKKLGVATLNAEKSLNSLTLQMIEELTQQLEHWQTDPQIVGVLIKGQGRAFCAGGDIRALYDSMRNRSEYVQTFFEKEYTLDASLYAYPKPLIVWAHGITMGGGMGVMQGARYRIATESTRLAMPEITIGLFPDVGASFFLKKVPKNWGLFIALSGVRLKGNEALQLKMADAYVKDEALPALLSALPRFECDSPESFAQNFTDWLETQKLATEGGDIFAHAQFVEAFLKNQNALDLMSWAKTYVAQDDWEKGILKNVLAACPTSLGLIYTLWEKSAGWSVNESFYHEWFVASQCGAHSDFAEGVRALLIDKDNQPHWNPASVETLTPAHLAAHFVSPRMDKKNPLEFLVAK